jgi:mannose-6-phosphate isomerase-like protein (cupin superfamily)
MPMIHNRSNIASYVTKDGSRVWELFHPGSSAVEGFSVAEALVEPGQVTEAHLHRTSQEVYYVLEGTGTMQMDGEAFGVGSGDAILIKPGTVHDIVNTGGGVLRILCVCSPPYAHGDTKLPGK